MPTGPDRRLRYEPAFDGLRGIGVVLMLLYHLEVWWLGEGPVFTIEMFFVLSGFLITTILLLEHEAERRIDLRRFWTRRARRLLPALLGMLGLVAVWLALPAPWGPTAVEADGMRGDGLSSMLYVSNWWYVAGSTGYFRTFGSPPPLLHTWSLSVEEQFYLVLAVGAAFGFRRWDPRRRGWLVAATVGALASAGWMALLARMGDLRAEGLDPFGIDVAGLPGWLRTFLNLADRSDGSRMYLGTDTRFQAVLVGVATALLGRRLAADAGRAWMARHPRTLPVLGGVGLVGLLGLFLGPSGQIGFLYYGGFLLCDVLTALVILGTQGQGPVALRTLLGSPALVAVGARSYSLYVWHFPLFQMLSEERTGVGGWPLDLLRLAVVVPVACASYRWLEQPIRTGALARHPAWRRGALAGGGLAVTGFLVVSSIIAPPDAGGSVPVAAGDHRPVVLVAGDSMAWTLGLDPELADDPAGRRARIRLSAPPGCVLTEGDRVNGTLRTRGGEPTCLDWPTRWKGIIDASHPPVSVLLAWGLEVQDHLVPDGQGGEQRITVPSPAWREAEARAVQQMIDVLSSGGGHVLLLTLPCLDATAADATHRNTMAVDIGRVRAMNDLLREVAARNPASTTVVDLFAHLCPDGEHHVRTIDGVKLTADGVHFLDAGAAKVWEWLRLQVAPYLPA